MGQTQTFQLPFPEESDPPDGAGQIQALASRLDLLLLAPGQVVTPSIVDAKGDLLAGADADQLERLPVGADGQVLTADSGETLGVRWGSPIGSGGGIPAEIIDARGDLIVGTGPDSPARLAAGSDGQLLAADSTQPTGLRWVAGGGGGGGAVVATTLPASPADGLEVILVDSLTAPAYAWQLRYVASVSGAYKWLFVGGAPADAFTAAAEPMDAQTWVTLSGGPSLTVPREGIYDTEISFSAANSAAIATGWMSPLIAGEGPLPAWGATLTTPAISGGLDLKAYAVYRHTLTAGAQLSARYQTRGVINFAHRRLRVTPVMVS